jgi:short-subunit dehydrogenase
VAIDIRGARVLVTGASSGIGAALAEEFAAREAVVGICARRRDHLDEVLERCRARSPRSLRWVVDLADPSAVDVLASSVLDELGGVDILVNNAGIPKRRHAARLDASVVEAVMSTNFFSAARLTLALLPQMLERGSGRIVNVSSVAATLSSPGEAAYAASKAALAVFGEAMAVDLWSTGVKILNVYPGVVDTDLFRIPGNDAMVASVDPVPVSEVVEQVLDALGRDAVQVYVPSYFEGLAAQKASDVGRFLAGSAAYVASSQGAA